MKFTSPRVVTRTITLSVNVIDAPASQIAYKAQPILVHRLDLEYSWGLSGNGMRTNGYPAWRDGEDTEPWTVRVHYHGHNVRKDGNLGAATRDIWHVTPEHGWPDWLTHLVEQHTPDDPATGATT